MVKEMTLEEKLKAKSFTQMKSDNFHVPTMYLHKPALFLEDALSICQEAVDEAKIEALYDIRGYADFMDNTLIEILHNKIKELKEKL